MDTIIFIAATLTSILASMYFFAQSQVDNLKKNWVEYRCNPLYMPAAGLVGDDVMTNFTKCTMKGFHDYVGFVMDPIMGEFSVLNDTIGEIGSTMVSMRTMFSGVRGGFLSIVGSVFGKIQNVMSQTQYIIIRMRTLMSRVVGIMYSFVYIFYGGMQTGQSVMNGPIGSAMSFLCFDEDTVIQTFNGPKLMKNVVIGDRLTNNLALVTSVYSIDAKGVDMYSLSGIIVSGSHKVKYKNKFIRVDKHPSAKKVPNKCNRLVCLNTTNHRISIKNYEFLDFVETDDSTYLDFKNRYIQTLYNGVSSKITTSQKTGVFPNTKISLINDVKKAIKDIQVGDVLDNGDIVKGVCSHVINTSKYVEIAKGILTAPDTWIYKDNAAIRANGYGNIQIENDYSMIVVYQLITESSMYPVIGNDNSRTLIIDELETTEPFYHSMKDTIITSGSFRGKLIVV
jgi:hypothetical protein